MSNFLETHKNQDETRGRDAFAKQLRQIERLENDTLSPEKFNFMLEIAMNNQDTRGALQAYHWLKSHNSTTRLPSGGVILNFSNKNHAALALNYVKEGLIHIFKINDISTAFENKIVSSIHAIEKKEKTISPSLQKLFDDIKAGRLY